MDTNTAETELPSRSLRFESGKDLWALMISRYEPLSMLVRSLSEMQIRSAQHLLDGMVQETKLSDPIDRQP